MSFAATPPAGAQQAPGTAPAVSSPAPQAGESCPLCGAPLHPTQEWCLRCGAAARTRLAASPNWKGPIAALALLAALSLGVIAAAGVKLAGETGPAPIPITHTVTGPAAPTAALPTATVPTATVPATTTPAGGAKPGASTATTPLLGGTTAPGAAAATPRATPTTTTNAVPGTRKRSAKEQKQLESLNLSGTVHVK